MSGLEGLRRLQPREPPVAVVRHTARQDGAVVVQAMHQGAVTLLPKPCDVEGVVRRFNRRVRVFGLDVRRKAEGWSWPWWSILPADPSHACSLPARPACMPAALRGAGGNDGLAQDCAVPGASTAHPGRALVATPASVQP